MAGKRGGEGRIPAIGALRCWLGRSEAEDDARVLDVLESACADACPDIRTAAAGVLRRCLTRDSHGLTAALSGRAWHWAGLDLRGVCLDDVDLRRADMRGVRLDGASLRRARLDGVDGYRADMRGATLAEVSLNGADFSGARLPWADLSDADVRGARFNGANLDAAALDGIQAANAFFSCAVLTHASLAGACLRGANLFGARLDGARLDGCDLGDTGVTPDRIDSAGWRVRATHDTRWGCSADRSGRNPLAIARG